MKIKRIKGLYFSPTNTTKEIISFLTKSIAEQLQLPWEVISYTLPEERKVSCSPFTSDELILWGTPVYAGRIPNKTLEYVKSALIGEATPMIPIVVYGNRSYDNALSELAGIMKDNGGIPVAGAAVVARHTFSQTLGKGRPDQADYEKLERFCQKVSQSLQSQTDYKGINLTVPGEEHPEKYYVPKKEDGTPAKFLKAKPQVRFEQCSKCSTCATLCPMGSVQVDPNVQEGIPSFDGICIKCQACIRNCPSQALYFEDEAFLSHVRMVETNFAERKEPAFFFATR